MPSNSPREKNAAPPLPEPLRVPVADSHTHLDMQDGTVE
ncbi:MAG: AraC family transcriptional regulator, partial [Streptomyces sp.]|nr:AraC family transcriptional regulator [Streptomyces sp.]